MAPIAYTVAATFPDNQTRQQFVDWLLAGHIQAVIDGGASLGQVVIIDEPSDPPRAEARYVFPNRDALITYIRDHAPRLRAEGQRLFGPDKGVQMSRTIGRFMGQSAVHSQRV